MEIERGTPAPSAQGRQFPLRRGAAPLDPSLHARTCVWGAGCRRGGMSGVTGMLRSLCDRQGAASTPALCWHHTAGHRERPGAVPSLGRWLRGRVHLQDPPGESGPGLR